MVKTGDELAVEVVRGAAHGYLPLLGRCQACLRRAVYGPPIPSLRSQHMKPMHHCLR